ncbi:helix-turn-helix transcriptional regulator [Candidatus Kaiserbacteria bacterium]|nr:helix-turn-helix transcriptional regulator [Candidatus Kaiserbacteria bacterium]
MLRTKRQRAILARKCPVAKVADIIGDSATLLIIRDLASRAQGFTDLELSLQGISSRTICDRLKVLEKRGIVVRIPKPDFYPRVNWKLTQKGRALCGIIDAMRAYGKKYL